MKVFWRRAGVNAALFLGASAFWLIPLEWLARTWVERQGDPLDRAFKVLRADAKVGWRQREGFNGQFLGLPLRTNTLGFRERELDRLDPAAKRILLLGPSSSFGWGVRDEETYARQLEAGLGGAASVVNAGVIGFSTWQGARLYGDPALRKLKSDLVIIAYGVNDVDRYRFFFNDPEPDRPALSRLKPGLIGFQNFAANAALLRVASRAGMVLRDKIVCPRQSGALQSLRVPPADFEANLRELIRSAKKDGAKVLVMTSAYRLPSFASPKPAELEKSRADRSTGQEALREGRYESALESFALSLKAEPDQCDVHYYAGSAQAGLGRCAEARRSLAQARSQEPKRIERDLRAYNLLAARTARREGAMLLDVEKALGSANARFFVDPVHFSAEGNRLVAQALRRAIVDKRLLH